MTGVEDIPHAAPVVLLEAWRRQAPTITVDEVIALLAVLEGGGTPVARLLRAYRAGVAAATPAERPLSGFSSKCPTCESVHVASILWQRGGSMAPAPDGVDRPPSVVMWARCYDDQTIYRPATGEVWPGDPIDLTPTTEAPDHG